MRSKSVLSSVYADGKDAMGINAYEIGQRVRELRKGRKLTQQELADAIGISLNSVSKIEPGMRVPSIEVFVALSDFFNVTIDYLVLGK